MEVPNSINGRSLKHKFKEENTFDLNSRETLDHEEYKAKL